MKQLKKEVYIKKKSIMTKKKSIKWIGLAKVVVLNESDILDGDKAAFTNALGLAKTKTEFRNKVKNKFYSMDLNLLRLEEIESFADRLKNHNVGKNIIKISKRLSETNEVGFSIFHTFP